MASERPSDHHIRALGVMLGGRCVPGSADLQGFIIQYESHLPEIIPDHVISGEQFFDLLKQVPGVTDVRWQTSKSSQMYDGSLPNVRWHILVTSELGTSELGPGSASPTFEFVLTRYDHMKDRRLPFTVTACFKEPSPDLVPEAWHILREVVKGKELAPDHVDRYMQRVLHRWGNNQLYSQLGHGAAGPFRMG